MEPPSRPVPPLPPTDGSSVLGDGTPPRPPATPPPPQPPRRPELPRPTGGEGKSPINLPMSDTPKPTGNKPDSGPRPGAPSGSDAAKGPFGAGIPLSKLEGLKEMGTKPPMEKMDKAPSPGGSPKPFPPRSVSTPSLPAGAEPPLRPLSDAELTVVRSGGESPRPSGGVRGPGLSVPPPPRPPETPPTPPRGTPPVIPGLPPVTPPPAAPKVDRNIRPRRFAILILIIIGFIGGIILAVWAFLRRPATPPPTTETPVATDGLFGSPAPSDAGFEGRDSDGDGLTDEQETQLGTDLTRSDTDSDGYTDKQELDAGFDPLGPGKLDTDRDGLSDPAEACWQTDPRNADTDGDGYLDGQEVANGYNPLVPSPNDKFAPNTAPQCPA